MSDLTDSYANAVLSHSFDNVDMDPAPDSVYVALHTGDPGGSGELNEVTAASYSRQQVTTDTGFTVSGTSVQNDVEILFPTAEESWGTMSHFSIHTAADNTGDSLWHSELDTTPTISAGDRFRLPVGTLTASDP